MAHRLVHHAARFPGVALARARVNYHERSRVKRTVDGIQR